MYGYCAWGKMGRGARGGETPRKGPKRKRGLGYVTKTTQPIQDPFGVQQPQRRWGRDQWDNKDKKAGGKKPQGLTNPGKRPEFKLGDPPESNQGCDGKNIVDYNKEAKEVTNYQKF